MVDAARDLGQAALKLLVLPSRTVYQCVSHMLRIKRPSLLIRCELVLRECKSLRVLQNRDYGTNRLQRHSRARPICHQEAIYST